MSKVCFLLTVYNKEAWIAQTLQTIMTQTLKDIEIVVWNDGSTDGSMDIVKYYADQDDRIKICGTEDNHGIAKAYNDARCEINSDYVCISSGDDLYDPKRAQITADYFDKHPEKVILYGGFWRVSANGKPIEHKPALPYNKDELFKPNNTIYTTWIYVCKKTCIT